jgi:uncharacterized protein (DUF58 family)
MQASSDHALLNPRPLCAVRYIAGVMMPFDIQPAQAAQKLRSVLLQALASIDIAAWRRFFLALLGLSLALYLALYATALSQSGLYVPAAAIAAFSLLLTALVAVRVVPYLARRSALDRWLMKVEYEFTREGAVYLAVIAVIALAALNTGNNLLFIILSCMIAAIAASGVCSRIVLQGLELEFSLPEHIFAGRPIYARFRLANRKRWFPTFSVTISGSAPRGRPVACGALPAILLQEVYIPHLPRRKSVRQEVRLTFPRRGRYLQDTLRISTRFPFGFLRKTRSISCGQEVLALPNIQPTGKFLKLLPSIGAEMDNHFKGRSHDLYAIRDYQQSDSARHIDWKATARSQQLMVREFTREDERRVRLMFDPRVPDARPATLAKFEKGVEFCACLAWHFYEAGTTLGFITRGFGLRPAPSGQVIYPILEALALMEPIVPIDSAFNLPIGDSIQSQAFQIILTYQSQELFPAGLRQSSYFVFMDSL